jgi:serine/threonine protein kinase
MIAGRYQPLEPPQSGAPLRALDQQTAQTVLLREVPTITDSPTADAVRPLAARGIFHPALITLFDVTVGPDSLLLAYEYVQAQSLKQLSGGHALHPRRAAELMSEIADAVAELHSRGVIHGAINFDTVLVTMKGKAKLDRLGDPSLAVPAGADETTDLRDIVTVLREVTRKARGTLPILDVVLEHDDGAALGSAATLAASLRAAAARPSEDPRQP